MTTIDLNWLNLNRREGQDFLPSLSDYQKTTNGTKTLLETANKATRLVAPELTGAASILESAANVLAATFIPSSTLDALSTLSSFGWHTIREFADALLNWCSCAALFTENPILGRVTQVAEGAYDATDLHLSYNDYCKAADLEDSSNGEVKDLFTHAKTYYWLRTARTVTSIAAMVLGLALLAGAQWITGTAVLCLSLVASLFATLRDTHEIGGKYPILKFDHPVQVIA